MQSSLLGVGIGVLPDASASVATTTAYGLSKRTSKEPQEHGKGSVEGLTAATSAANASVGGTLVPMMTLGIPGDPMTAVLIGALMIYGLAPGPDLFNNASQIVSGIYLGYLIALVFTLIFSFILTTICTPNFITTVSGTACNHGALHFAGILYTDQYI